MSRKILLEAVFAILVISMLATPISVAFAQSDAPRFSGSDLPPPEPDKPPPPWLRDVFAIGDTSPLGTSASSVRPEALFETASSFLRSGNGHPANPAEAAFWLKRAIAAAPDVSGGKARAWALMKLGVLLSADQQGGRIFARQLWELAAAWNEPDALCNLGELAADEKDVKQALLWYDRAKKAGCARAGDAITQLLR